MLLDLTKCSQVFHYPREVSKTPATKLYRLPMSNSPLLHEISFLGLLTGPSGPSEHYKLKHHSAPLLTSTDRTVWSVDRTIRSISLSSPETFLALLPRCPCPRPTDRTVRSLDRTVQSLGLPDLAVSSLLAISPRQLHLVTIQSGLSRPLYPVTLSRS